MIEKNLGRFATSGSRQYLQSLDYQYNNQGWLTKINTPVVGFVLPYMDYCNPNSNQQVAPMYPEGLNIITDDDQDLFYLNLGYDQALSGSGVPQQKNGNISSIKWHGPMEQDQTMSYNYDYLNRIKKAVHGEIDGDGITHTIKNNYDEDFDYDVRGNITKSKRNGMVEQREIANYCYQPQQIDNLTYSYSPNTNKLIQVVDSTPCETLLILPTNISRNQAYAADTIRSLGSTVPCNIDLNLTVSNQLEIYSQLNVLKGCDSVATLRVTQAPCPNEKFTEGFNQQSENGQYLYDNAGNMIYDPNKQLSLQYNHLNLPYRVVGQGDLLEFNYDAEGNLLGKVYKKNDTIVSERDYLRGNEIINDTLESLLHSDGRILYNNAAWTYEYQLRDHLGNTRIVFSDRNGDGNIVQSESTSTNELLSIHNYYAFGLETKGKWLNAANNLPKTRHLYNGKEEVEEMEWGVLRYGARDFDPAVGRFLSVDPRVSSYPSWTPYHYVHNNPILLIDPTGMSADTLVPASNRPLMYQKGYAEWAENQPDDTEISPTITERLYMAGQWAGLALPTAKFLTAGKAAGAMIGLSKTETVLTETSMAIHESSAFKAGIEGMKQGKCSEQCINGVTIIFEAEGPFSGLTLQGENAFVIGKEALKSKEEILNTVLHEMYRLNTSATKGGNVSQNMITSETKSVVDYVKRAFEALKTKN